MLRDDDTPLMKQYWELKSQAPDAFLFFRMGDFYELFGNDAVEASKLLEITLTSRDKNRTPPTPMAGIPHHAAQAYFQRLLDGGKKVAIGEQMEDPETVKGRIVKRELVRVLTPAIQFETEGAESHFLAFCLPKGEKGVLVALDASTGEVLVSEEKPFASLALEAARLTIRHLLVWGDSLSLLDSTPSVLIEKLPANYLTPERALEAVGRHYQNWRAFFSSETQAVALGIVLTYVLRSQRLETLKHLKPPSPLSQNQSLELGALAAQHLDLGELFRLINETRSTLGARQLKRWIYSPLRTSQAISKRQEEVRQFISKQSSPLGDALSRIADLERIMGRITAHLATPKDTYALGSSLEALQTLSQWVDFEPFKSELQTLNQSLSPLCHTILKAQKSDAPFTSRDGGIFQKNYHPELDRLLDLTEHGQQWLISLESSERKATGISSLKIKYNRVFGYFIEITQAHLKNVPSHYQRKQTMVGAERFFTEELKRFEEEILTASTRQKGLEGELFQELLKEIEKLDSPLMEASRVIGEIDSLLSLSLLCQRPNWCFPMIDDSLNVDISKGRHPLVDAVKRGRFIPNDLKLEENQVRTLLITGPNMGGKSTVMRQMALIVILGQTGAPVPAQKAHWGAFSSIYTRIGAHDAISKGQSTFMVEMNELAQILNCADERSLIILDEIGRGTSTYDGISVAWASLEWICQKIRARTLFATHYHELIQLADHLPLLRNAHMAVEVQGPHQLRFLYELKAGPTNDSFGIYVAELAGLPKPLIRRAWDVLKKLEDSSSDQKPKQLALSFERTEDSSTISQTNTKSLLQAAPQPPQATLHPAIEKIREVNIDETTPFMALNIIHQLKNLLH